MKSDKGITGVNRIYRNADSTSKPAYRRSPDKVMARTAGKTADKINKNVKEAAALRDTPESGGVPEIVALGRGATAERIIKKAKEHDVPLYEDANLAHTLNYLRVGDEIPRELYEVVARILVFVNELDGKYDVRRKIPYQGERHE